MISLQRKTEPLLQKPEKKSKKIALTPTRTEKCVIDRDHLPVDAVNKGFETNLIQDLIFTADIIQFQRQVYYSPSEKKRFVAALPAGYEGEFGPGLKSFILALYHDAYVSQPNILKLLIACGISISAASISRILIGQASQFHQEKKDIVEAGFQSTRFQHIDDTGARVNGQNHHVQVLCNPFYTAYFTTPSKDRLSILKLLFQGDMEFEFTPESFDLMTTMKLPQKQLDRLKQEVPKQIMNQTEINELLHKLYPDLKKQHKNRVVIQEAAAITAYQNREDAIHILLCDDAGQFKKITEHIGACWVHEGRHYKKLKPILKANREALETFLKRFWVLYHELLLYKLEPDPDRAALLSKQFDELVTSTGYEALDERIAKTASRKKELLLVLEHPEIELHNNPAELGARAQARKRDVSYQTKNEAGTTAKDIMMTIVQTAHKLGVNILHYFYDRISKSYSMTSLADRIKEFSTQSQYSDQNAT